MPLFLKINYYILNSMCYSSVQVSAIFKCYYEKLVDRIICSTPNGSKKCLNLIRNKGECTFEHECIAQCFAMIHNNRKPAGVLSLLVLQPDCLLRAPLLAT